MSTAVRPTLASGTSITLPPTTALPRATRAATLENRLAGCRRGESHNRRFTVSYQSLARRQRERSNPIFLGGCTSESCERTGRGDGYGGGEKGEDLREERSAGGLRLALRERRLLCASHHQNSLHLICRLHRWEVA